MPRPYKILKPTFKDAAGLARVHIDTWRATYAGIVPPEHLAALSYEKREARWSAALSDPKPGYHAWVAKDSGNSVIGFCDGGKNRDRSLPFDGELYALYLLPDYQGRGIGKHLFLDSLEQLFRDGFSSAVTWVLEENPTLRFYERMGGKRVGEKWEEIGGKRLKEIALAWESLTATLKEHRPALRHPAIKHYEEIQEDDHSHYYPGSREPLSVGSPFSKAMGLRKLGIHHELLPPGRRTSWPHAEENEEEFVYVIEGNPQVWIDGEVYSLNPGDGIGFQSGTGLCHTVINNSDKDVRLLVVGEASKRDSKIYYPLNPTRKEQVKEAWWDEVPRRNMGPHDGLPDKLRESTS